ncbi:MFS transporter [Yunchengibacter salinarum]|uniref:MFS transporter n=1 Tax=Yunchengibacter salinarum TaxID=3133399 RepID=UPI0035B60EB8
MPVLLIAVFIDLVGFGIIVPILPFIAKAYGGSAFTGTALISIYSLMTFLSGPIWGRLSDRIGRKPALMFTFMGAVISYITLAHADSLAMLFLARGMSGAMAGNVGVVMASIADRTHEGNRGRALGWLGGVFGLGFAVGPGLGGLLGSMGSGPAIYLPGLTAAGLSLTAFILTAVLMRESHPLKADTDITPDSTGAPGAADVAPAAPPMRLSLLFTTPTRGLLFAMFTLLAVGQSITFSITPFWAESALGWSEREVGFLMMAVGLMVAAVQTFALGPIFRAVGEARALMGGMGLALAGAAIISFGGGTVWSAIIGFPLTMTGMTAGFPALNSIVSMRTGSRDQGAALGLANGMSALGRVAGPLSAGSLFSAATPALPFLVLSVMACAILAWASGQIGRERGG